MNERKEGGRLREAARCVTKRCWVLFWRDTGALARAAVRASVRGAHPNGVEWKKLAEGAHSCLYGHEDEHAKRGSARLGQGGIKDPWGAQFL